MSFFAFRRYMADTSRRPIVRRPARPVYGRDSLSERPTDGDFFLGLLVALALSFPFWLALLLVVL